MNNNFFKFKKILNILEILAILKIDKDFFFKFNPNVDKNKLSETITDLVPINSLKEHSLSFLTSKKKIAAENGICITCKDENVDVCKNIIRIPASNPRKSFEKIIDKFISKKKSKDFNYIKDDHKLISSNASIGKNVHIGPFSSIGSNVSIGDNVFIGNGVNIEDNCIIGNDCIIESGVCLECTILDEKVTINHNSVIGKYGFGFIPFEENTKIFNHIGGGFYWKKK